MRILKTLLIAIFVVFYLAGCYLDDNGSSGAMKEEKTLTFKGVDRLKLANVTGGIEVTGWDKEDVEVSYLKKAASGTILEKLRVSVRQEGGVLDIDTYYPRRCRRCNISFKVFVPRSMKEIGITTVTGSVALTGMGHVENAKARTVTGAVKAELACRDCDFSSVTGRIQSEFKKIDEGGTIRASMTTGSVKLVLPDDFTGKVSLHTVTGSVHTDFPITTSGTLRKTRIDGSIGQGSSRIKANTVTGSIRLLKR